MDPMKDVADRLRHRDAELRRRTGELVPWDHLTTVDQARWLLMAEAAAGETPDDVTALRDYARAVQGVGWLDDAPDETIAEHITEARETIRALRLSWKQTAFETLERAIVGPTPQWENHPDNRPS